MSRLKPRTPQPAQQTSQPSRGTDTPRPVDTSGPTLATHRVTYSDRLKVFIGPGEVIYNFLRPLRRLDGYHRYTIDMTCLPEPMRATEITQVVSSAPGRDYLRCTGSADAMAIEMSATSHGVTRRYTIGRGGDRTGLPDTDVSAPSGVHVPRVYSDEVFTAEEASEIFTSYFQSGSVAPGFYLRETVA
ncbi:hypothetical protein [Nocardia callitridis]|uniref:Uncharacterized protein n=1 Tax=Nocardia callitridis TaxID=648753 RepID=A0ABP9JU27_9NOCA